MGRIRDGLVRGSDANGSIDRILAAVRTRQRGERQNMRFVKAGHWTNDGHRQRVLGQRAGFIGAQDIHGRRFVHRREARRQNAKLC